MPFNYAEANPDAKALRRILYALLLSAALCFAICLTLVFRQGHVRPHNVVHRSPCAAPLP